MQNRADLPPGLAGRLQERIAAMGPMTFSEFMDAALYDPDEGFYRRNRVGEKADFVTSPHISPVFGTLVARQVAEFWSLLGRPHPFTVVEVGAGPGVLAGQILASLPKAVRDAVVYVGVERSTWARDALDRLGLAALPSLSELPPVEAGCVLANELLDNLPFHRVRGTKEGLAELFVGVDHGRFVLVEGPPSSEEIARLAPDLRPGEEAVVNLAALQFLDEVMGVLRRGYVWVVDYGWPDGGRPVEVHGYRRHRLEEDVLSEPGSRDITAGIDFGALARRAEGLGFCVWGPVSQRDALIALGFREWDDEALAKQAEAQAARQGMRALRIYSERNRASLLVDRAGPGGFFVICFGVGTDRPPRSVS